MNNVKIAFLEKETRPAMILIDVKGIELHNVEMMKAGNAPLISADQVTNFEMKKCKGLKDVTLQEISKQTF